MIPLATEASLLRLCSLWTHTIAGLRGIDLKSSKAQTCKSIARR
jgi:hypothetical protein